VSAHTPGPWILGNEDEQCCDVECGGGRTSISLNRFDSLMRDEFHISRAEMLANAHLVEASPDLLAALKECLESEERRRTSLKDGAPASAYSDARLARVRAAIAKAEGKP